MVGSLRWCLAGVGVVAFAAGLAGCAMHPLPGDFSRKSTYQIIEKIRCEGAESLRGIPKGHPFLKSVYIGYDFDFNITETNAAGNGTHPGAHASFHGARPSGRTVDLDVNANASLTRAAQRTFRIIESFEQLQTADCSPGRNRGNLLYPIAGSIGMDEIVRTYVGLERITTLAPAFTSGSTTEVGPIAGATSAPGFSSTSPVVFADVLEFTTTLGASANPTLTLSAPAVGSFKLTNLSLFGSAGRTDSHKLTVVIARDPSGAEPPAQRAARRDNSRAQNTENWERDYREAIKQYQTNPTNNLSNNLFANSVLSGPNSTRYIRTLDALQQKQLPADTRVYVELERRRSQEDEDRFLTRVIELIKPTP